MSDHDSHQFGHDQGQDDAFIAGVADSLRAGEPSRADLTERVMRIVRANEVAARTAVRGWWTRRHTIELSFSAVGALAAAVMIAVAGALSVRAIVGSSRGPQTVATAPVRADTVHIVRFVLTAPSASSVSLVGDFNDWQAGATPLRPAGAPGLWVVSLPLPRGLHQYAFIIDGTRWTPDPATSTTVTDDFGTTTSVIAVGDAT